MAGRFWKNVASVLSGTALAQAIPIVGALILARLFVPEAYGSYSVWLGAVLILAVALTLRLDAALAVIDDGPDREEAVVLVLATAVATSLILAAAATVAWLVGIVPDQMGRPLLFFSVIVAALMSAGCDTWQGLAAADGTYRTLIKIRVAQALFILAGQLVAALVARSAEALVAGHMTGFLLALLFAQYARPLQAIPISGLRPRMTAFWRRHSRFPKFALPADTINSVSAQLPLLILSARFGNDVAGIFALTMRVLGAPIGLLGRSVLDVFRRYAAEAFRQRGDCRTEYVSTFRALFLFALVFVVATMLIAEQFFAFAFGENWRLAGTFAIWLAPLFALRFMGSPLSYIFYIVGRQNIDLYWQLGLSVVVVAALLLPTGLRGTILAYSYGYSAMYLVYIGLSYSCSKGSIR